MGSVASMMRRGREARARYESVCRLDAGGRGGAGAGGGCAQGVGSVCGGGGTSAALFRQLRQQGTPVPTNDLWIAALVTEHGARLCTRDAHFGKLAQLDLV